MKTKTWIFGGKVVYVCDWCNEDIVNKEGYGFRYTAMFGIPNLCKLEYDSAEQHLCSKCAKDLKKALNMGL